MKRAALFITVGAVLVVGGYYAYEQFFAKKPVKAWDLIPQEAILVYETGGCGSCASDIRKSALGQIITRATFYERKADSLAHALSKILQEHEGVLVSLHGIKKDDFDFVYYVPEFAHPPGSTEKIFQRTGTEIKIREREFNSVKIQEALFHDQVFSWARLEGVWIGSFTPFLIEDVIRTYKTKSPSGFGGHVKAVRQLPRIREDAGNLYVSLEKLPDWMALFSESRPLSYAVGKSALLDIKADENFLTLNGFSLDSSSFLSIFRHQSPVPFSLKQRVPNRTIVFKSYGISQGTLFLEDLKTFMTSYAPYWNDTLLSLSKRFKIDVARLFGSIKDEIGVCTVESSRGRDVSRIMIIETGDPEYWKDVMGKLAEASTADTVFYEKFADYDISEVPIQLFSEKLFGVIAKGFKQTFYTVSGNLVIIGENLDDLKQFLGDIETEDVWGRSVVQNRFLERTLLESNVSIFINTPKTWNVLNQHLNQRWQRFIIGNRRLLQSLRMGSIQLSNLNSTFYTNVSWAYETTSDDAVRERIITNFNRGIRTLTAVKSHVDRTNEVLIQDSLNDLSLVASDGRLLWTLPIGDRIIGEVTQIDFYNNGKLQYFFSTQDALHIIDRLGNYVPPYPLHIRDIHIKQASVIDYDHSKKYRFLLADEKGKLLMFDKEGNNLDGWKPNDAGGELAMPPRHHRIKGKDYIIAIRKDGVVCLFNRRGEPIKGFPLQLNLTPAGDYFVEAGKSIPDTYFVIVSRDGYRIRFNTEGKVQSQETLLKHFVDAEFSLLSEKTNKSYLILQKNARTLTFSDEAGRKMFSHDLTSEAMPEIKYFDFGAGSAFITITSKVQELSFIYDTQGNPLTPMPLGSHAIEIRPVNPDRFSLFLVNRKRLIIRPL